ncbi:MAG: hypothetical protein ACYSRZ_04850, partial [Planctomycetota bacterium]
GYDDRSGFTKSIVDGSGSGRLNEDQVWLGEAGLRLSGQYWKVYPSVKSRLGDLEQLRHMIRPELTVVAYAESDPVVEQRDMLNLAISQRLQTRRRRLSPQGRPQYETVDWMRLDTDFTWVNNSSDSGPATARILWNRPMIPLSVMAAPEIFNGDFAGSLKKFELFGPSRNYFSADYALFLSDTLAVLADGYYDLKNGTLEQFNVGISHYRWPNLNYYIGSRYLKSVDVLDEKGTNALTFAATYEIDPRYTLVFSHQYDFDYGTSQRSDITLIRRYHRIYCGLSFSADQSLDRQSVVISFWPQGVSELAIGSRRYMGLTK